MTNGFANGFCKWLLMDNFALSTTMPFVFGDLDDQVIKFLDTQSKKKQLKKFKVSECHCFVNANAASKIPKTCS